MNLDALEAEYSKLQADHAAFARQLEQVQTELKPLNEIRYWISQVLGPEKVKIRNPPEKKFSVLKQIKILKRTPQKQMNGISRNKM